MSALSEAFLSAQKALPRLTKDSEADTGKFHYRYLSLEGLLREVLPVLHHHGLSLMQMPGSYEGRTVLWTHLIHFSGDEYKSSMLLPVAPDATAQQVGSALTYCRRYAVLCLLGLAPDEDDDGAKASGADRLRDHTSRAAAPGEPSTGHLSRQAEDPQSSGGAVRSAHGNAPPEVSGASAVAPDTSPTREQHALLAVLIKELDDGREMNEAYWIDEMRDYIRRRFNKVSRTQLTREEMSSLIGWAQDRKGELEIPFN